MESRQNIWDLWSCSYTLKYSSTSALLTILQGTVSCLLYVCRRFKQPPKYPVALWIWVTKSQTHMLRNNAHTQTFLVSCQSFTANTCRPLKVGSADLLVSVEAATLQGGPRAQIKSWSSSELLAINVCPATVSSQVSFQPPYRLAPHYSLAQSWSHRSVIIIPAMLALNTSTPYFHWEYSLIWVGGWKHAGIPQGLGDLSKLL